MTSSFVRGDGFSLRLNERAHIGDILVGERHIRLPVEWMTYELDGQEANVAILPAEGGLVYRLSARDRGATLSVSGGREVRFHFEPDSAGGVGQASLSLFLPGESVLHLAEAQNIGRRLDQTMPVGESHRCKLNYNLVVIDLGGVWLRLRTDHWRLRTAELEVTRHPGVFGVTFRWTPDADVYLATFQSMTEATRDFRLWFERTFGVSGLRDAGRGLPDWIHNVRLVITADMLRSNWEISHDYRDVLNMARDLKAAGCGPDTLIYIPGWQGAYDSTHPTYRPRPELGGASAFREMVDGIHACGLRAMIHTTGWGIDPYHPEIDQLQRLVKRNDAGEYIGWQVNREWLPPKKPLRFQTEAIPLRAEAGARSFMFETALIPDHCEAHITLGGIAPLKGRVRITAGRRMISSPPGWFEAHREFEYPFPLHLEPGVNSLSIEALGDEAPAWEGSWYRIRYTFAPTSPYQSWTWPILMADTFSPEYIDLFVRNVSTVIREFDLDAVHVDATWFNIPEYGPPSKDLLYALRERLPGVPICGEAVLAFEEMGFFAIAQSASQSLIHYPQMRSAPGEQGSLPAKEGFEQAYAWLNQESPVCDFAREFTYSYPHLCAANAFVPVGKVCNTFPPRRMPRESSELWKVLRDARRLDYIPGLRVNYRQYGLDNETRTAVAELTRP